jgi:hypothetical protein
MTVDTHPIFKELFAEDIALENIYLDPNNPRFVSMTWDNIPDERIIEEAVQKIVIEKLYQDFAVDRLVMNMEINGFLPIDRVVLRKIDDTNYVVLEGNRRICAAKILKQKFTDNPSSIAKEIIDSIEKIPCLVYTGTNTEASWIFQGLRHIMGIQEWSAFNKARLIVTLMEEEDLTLTEVGKRFGLTPFGAGQWVRGYFAFKQAKENSDYTKEVDERAYPYLQELFSRSNSPIREWMKWNESTKTFENELNFNELLSWLYPRNTEEADESIDPSSLVGDWKNRKIYRSDDLRSVSFLISKSPKEFEFFRTEGNLERAYTIAVQKQYEEEAKKLSDPTNELFESLDIVIKNLENIPYRILKDGTQKGNLFEKLNKISAIINELSE